MTDKVTAGSARDTFDTRLAKYYDELKWLYMELYDDDEAFDYFLKMLRRSFRERKRTLRDVDKRRESNPDMHRSNRMMGMMLYVENFAGDDRVLGLSREYDGKRMLALFNFSPDRVRTEIVTSDRIDMTAPDREYIKGEGPMSEYWLEPYGYRWLLETDKPEKKVSHKAKKGSGKAKWQGEFDPAGAVK